VSSTVRNLGKGSPSMDLPNRASSALATID
jgi:hypothetical protein